MKDYLKYYATKGQPQKATPVPQVRNAAYPLHTSSHTSKQYAVAAKLAGELTLAQ